MNLILEVRLAGSPPRQGQADRRTCSNKIELNVRGNGTIVVAQDGTHTDVAVSLVGDAMASDVGLVYPENLPAGISSTHSGASLSAAITTAQVETNAAPLLSPAKKRASVRGGACL